MGDCVRPCPSSSSSSVEIDFASSSSILPAVENNLVYRYDTAKVDDGTGGGEEGSFSMSVLISSSSAVCPPYRLTFDVTAGAPSGSSSASLAPVTGTSRSSRRLSPFSRTSSVVRFLFSPFSSRCEADLVRPQTRTRYLTHSVSNSPTDPGTPKQQPSRPSQRRDLEGCVLLLLFHFDPRIHSSHAVFLRSHLPHLNELLLTASHL